MPPGVIIPELVYDDLEAAVAWLCQAFGFQERLRIGNHRSQLIFGGSSLIAVGKSGREMRPEEMSHSIMVRVEDVDRHFDQARKSGARIIQKPADYPYGERQYTADDIGGHRWTFSQSIADPDPQAWGGKLLVSTSDSS